MSCTPLPKSVKPVWYTQLARLPCFAVYVKFQLADSLPLGAHPKWKRRVQLGFEQSVILVDMICYPGATRSAPQGINRNRTAQFSIEILNSQLHNLAAARSDGREVEPEKLLRNSAQMTRLPFSNGLMGGRIRLTCNNVV